MLGKQWLNRYASIDVRGSAIERSQNRQQKLDGIVTWYFHYVMESLPIMLQFALLLLGCALSRYLWEVNTTVALVVLSVTSFGVASYTFFVVAGAASASCPYQTPGAQILHHISSLVLSALPSTCTLSTLYSTSSHALSTLYLAISHSLTIELFIMWWNELKEVWCSIGGIAWLTILILLSPIILLVGLVADAYTLVEIIVQWLVANVLKAHGWFHQEHNWFPQVHDLLHRVHGWFQREYGWDPQTVASDLQCISWMLQTSLDKTIHLFSLRLLATMKTLANFNPALISACFDVLGSCVSLIDGKVVILQGSEELAVVSALSCLRTLSHLITMDPTPSVFNEMCRWYTKTFPIETSFRDLPSYHCFQIIHNIFHPRYKQVQLNIIYRPRIHWRDYTPSSTEHAILIQLAQFEYQRKQPQKVPRWILHYGHHILSQDPLPPTSVITDCLSIIVIDLGITVPNTTTLDERYVHI